MTVPAHNIEFIDQGDRTSIAIRTDIHLDDGSVRLYVSIDLTDEHFTEMKKLIEKREG
ncbi:hypothetical protein ACGFJT_36795 [Actinomadura geliboluensis]|uniref:hypothetical protein n=1 Tax=Actinomadura geliboluensis TaxID=882440 RepID=UPI0037249B3D